MLNKINYLCVLRYGNIDMIKLFHKILSVVLAVVILTTTSGFRIYSHDCDCCGTDEISLVKIDGCCEDTPETIVCDLSLHQKAACCEGPEQTAHDCKDAQCCEIESDFFKLQESFEKSSVLTIKLPKLTNFQLQIIDTETLAEKVNIVFLNISKDTPPKIPNRDFVIFSHSLKIAC